jgi:magnesium chelatase family protein
MMVAAHEPSGFDGLLVHVEVDIRRGIPAVDLVGLAEGAVREARERVRAAVRNSGFEFPLDRVLVNLAPADFPKEGSAYDLPIALAILGEAGILPDPGRPILALGELRLDGRVEAVRGALPAVAAGLASGIEDFVFPESNLAEARSLGRGRVYGLSCLSEAVGLLERLREERPPADLEGKSAAGGLMDAEGGAERTQISSESSPPEGDFSDIRGLERARRALEVAAAGGHNVLLFGPPGSGKTMSAHRLPSILPDLPEEDAVAVTKLYSLSGLLPESSGPLRRPPFRAPHHSASREGLVGGGRVLRPGEASLAHKGVLFIDEAPEFHRDALQSLREPLEEGRVSLARAGRTVRLPADFQLVLAANPCPCGNLGREGRACRCSLQEIDHYWKRLGGPLLDRIDIRVPLRPADVRDLVGPPGESSASIRARVERAVLLQRERYRGLGFDRNSRIPAGSIGRFCGLETRVAATFALAVAKLNLSSRACHSALRLARTIADLAASERIEEDHLLEAIQHRRYGDGDYYWQMQQ